MLLVRPGAAQTADPLPVAGSLIYHALLYNRVNGSSTRGLGLRFAGRLAVRVADKTYLGFGGGSWARLTKGECGLSPDCDGYNAQSEAYVYQLYVQRYLSGERVFLRGGAGLAETRTVLPVDRFVITVTSHWRGALSAGGGIDIPLARHVYLTPSLDYTVLPGAVPEAQELGSALAVGVAITLH